MGGALAELTAFRIAIEFPNLRPLLRVISFGSITWGERVFASNRASGGESCSQGERWRELFTGRVAEGVVHTRDEVDSLDACPTHTLRRRSWDV